jgi:protein-disulfide isomerase
MSRHAEEVRLTVPVSARDHLVGPDTAPVTLLEYGDYQCPSCGAAFPIVHEVRRHLGDKLRFAFRNFPLSEIHPHAVHAAETAEAANAQGKFWEMHDHLFTHQAKLADAQLVEGARELGLDAERVRRELADGTYLPRVREDFSSGVRSGVNGTPTFYINGVRHDGDYSFGSLVRAIESAITA